MALSRNPFRCIVWSLVILATTRSVCVTGEVEVVQAAEVDVDDDVGKNVVEIVQARGYAVETHKVTTADNYVLTMYRLPKTTVSWTAASRLSATSETKVWLSFWRTQGYDVWLGNNRGTTWSREHVTYTDDDDEFWEFSWEDMGKYDLPAEIEYVPNETQSSTLNFVGHSEGTSQAFVGFSLDQKLAQKVSYFAALAPVAWTGQLTAKIFKAMATLHLEKWYQAFGISEFSAKSTFLQEIIGGFACTVADKLLNSAIALVAGPSVSTNTSRIPVYISQTPAGTSVKNMAHYAQNIRDNTFAPYDYGCKCKKNSDVDKCPESKCENKKVYGSFEPPAFPIGKMVYPRTGLYVRSADTIATAADIEKLRVALPSGTIVRELAVEEYSHLDLTWAYNANGKMYQDLLAQLDKYQGVGYTGAASTATISSSTDSSSANSGAESERPTESRTSFSFRQLD